MIQSTREFSTLSYIKPSRITHIEQTMYNQSNSANFYKVFCTLEMCNIYSVDRKIPIYIWMIAFVIVLCVFEL